MKILLYLILLLISTTAFAETHIIFLNGIDGELLKNDASKNKLRAIIEKAGYEPRFTKENVKYNFWSNPGDGFFDDKIELREQALISADALTVARAGNPNATAQNSPIYKIALGEIYNRKITNGEAAKEEARHVVSVVENLSSYINDQIKNRNRKLIIVSHSQGNFFAEAVDAYLRYNKTDAENQIYDDNLRFVGAASVASSTPDSRYISIREDNALDAHFAATAFISNFSLLPRNAEICNAINPLCKPDFQINVDASIHGFQEIYTSEFVDRVSGLPIYKILADMVNKSLEELTPPISSIKVITPTPTASNVVIFEPVLESSPNGGIKSFVWNFGDGGTLSNTGSQVMHNYNNSGTYTVTLTIIDEKGIQSSTARTIVVAPVVNQINITHLAPTTGTVGQSQKFSIIGTGLPTTTELNIVFNGCANITYLSKTENLHEFTCTPQSVALLTMEVRAIAGGAILMSQPITITPKVAAPKGVWMGWNGSKYTTEEVLQKPGYITKATANWGNLRLRLNTALSGDNFSVEFRTKVDPALGGTGYRDLGITLGNDFSTDLYDTSGEPRGTRHVTFVTRNGYSKDFFIMNSSTGNSGYIYQSGVLDNASWHKYKITVSNNIVTLHYDDMLKYSQSFSGTIGTLDAFYIEGLRNVELDTDSLKFMTAP